MEAKWVGEISVRQFFDLNMVCDYNRPSETSTTAQIKLSKVKGLSEGYYQDAVVSATFLLYPIDRFWLFVTV